MHGKGMKYTGFILPQSRFYTGPTLRLKTNWYQSVRPVNAEYFEFSDLTWIYPPTWDTVNAKLGCVTDIKSDEEAVIRSDRSVRPVTTVLCRWHW